MNTSDQPVRAMRPIPRFIFASRWLQFPLYLGLILAQVVYVVHFWIELTHLIEAAFGFGPLLHDSPTGSARGIAGIATSDWRK